LRECREFAKQRKLCKMAYSMEERVLTFKTLYQTSSFMTVQRYFLKKFNRRQICSQPSGTDA